MIKVLINIYHSTNGNPKKLLIFLAKIFELKKLTLKSCCIFREMELSIHSLSPSTVREVVRGYLPLICSTYVIYGRLCYDVGHQVLPTQPFSREGEDFSRGDKCFNHVPLITQPICFPPKGNT